MGIARIAGLAVVAGLTSLSAAAQTSWDMPTPYPDAEFHTQNIRTFAAEVEKATAGSLKINVHSGQSLFKHPEIKRAVQTGQVPIAEMLMANLLNEDAVFGVDAVPFLATSYADAKKLWDAQKPFVEKKLTAQGMQLLYVVPWPGQGFFTNKPIGSVADLKGVKFRTYNAATATMAKLMDAVPTIVEAVEIPQAFSTGIVDAMVTSGATGVRTKAWDFTKYFYDINAWLPKNMIFVNQRSFRQLTEPQRAAVTAAAAAAEKRGWDMSVDAANASNGDLAKGGMTVGKPAAQLVKDLQAIGAQMTTEWEKSAGADGTAILQAYRK